MDKYKSNVIEFPKTKNQHFREQQKSIKQTIDIIETGMTHAKHWENLPILPKDLAVLSNFGETIQFSPIVSARLISVLASQIIKLNLINEEYNYETDR